MGCSPVSWFLSPVMCFGLSSLQSPFPFGLVATGCQFRLGSLAPCLGSPVEQ